MNIPKRLAVLEWVAVYGCLLGIAGFIAARLI